MEYSNIVFLQDSEAKAALDILSEQGEKATFDHLQYEYNYGGGEIQINNSEGFTPWGTDDRLYKEGNYVMAYNLRIGYIGLTQIF